MNYSRPMGPVRERIYFAGLILGFTCLSFAFREYFTSNDDDIFFRLLSVANIRESGEFYFASIWPMLYFWIYAGVQYVFGESFAAIQFFSAFLSALCALPLALIGRELYGKRGLWLVAILYLLLPFRFMASVNPVSEIPFTLFSVSAVYFLLNYLRENRLYSLLLAGISLSFASMVRFEVWPLIPFLLVVVFIFSNLPKKTKIYHLSIFLPLASLGAGFELYRYWDFMGDPLFYIKLSDQDVAKELVRDPLNFTRTIVYEGPARILGISHTMLFLASCFLLVRGPLQQGEKFLLLIVGFLYSFLFIKSLEFSLMAFVRYFYLVSILLIPLLFRAVQGSRRKYAVLGSVLLFTFITELSLATKTFVPIKDYAGIVKVLEGKFESLGDKRFSVESPKFLWVGNIERCVMVSFMTKGSSFSTICAEPDMRVSFVLDQSIESVESAVEKLNIKYIVFDRRVESNEFETMKLRTNRVLKKNFEMEELYSDSVAELLELKAN